MSKVYKKNAEKRKNMKINELRTFNTIDIESREGATKDTHIVSGYASVFNSRTNIGGMFDEEISPGAFSRSLSNNSDICCLFNHNWDNVLGRTKNGTLKLWEDHHGLKFEVELPKTTVANDLIESMVRNDINACSFGFRVVQDEWNYSVEPAIRTVQEVELYEVSIVTMPAYKETEAALVRSNEGKTNITGGEYAMRKMTNQNIKLRKAFTDYITGNIRDSEARSLGIKINGGNAFVPKTVANEIIGYVEQHNPLRKHGTVVTVEGNHQYPVLTDDTQINVDVNADERDSGNVIEISSLGLKAALLEPVEFDVITIIKKKLIKSTNIDTVDLVIDVLKKEYLKKEIDYMFNGTNEKAFNEGSLLNKAKVFTPTETDPAKIIRELKNTTSTAVANNARWIVNKKAIEHVEDLQLPNGEPVLKTVEHEGAGARYFILGFPVDVTDIAKGATEGKAIFYFGDFSSFKIQEDHNGLETQTMYEVVGDYVLRNEIGLKLYHLLDGKLIYSDLEPTVYRLEV